MCSSGLRPGQRPTNASGVLAEAPKHDIASEVGMAALIAGDPLKDTALLRGTCRTCPLLHVRDRCAFVQPAVTVGIECYASQAASSRRLSATDTAAEEVRDRSEGGALASREPVEQRRVGDLVQARPVASQYQRSRCAECHQLKGQLSKRRNRRILHAGLLPSSIFGW